MGLGFGAVVAAVVSVKARLHSGGEIFNSPGDVGVFIEVHFVECESELLETEEREKR